MTWYVIAAVWFVVSVLVGVLAGRILARRFSPSGSLQHATCLPHPEGENKS